MPRAYLEMPGLVVFFAMPIYWPRAGELVLEHLIHCDGCIASTHPATQPFTCPLNRSMIERHTLKPQNHTSSELEVYYYNHVGVH